MVVKICGLTNLEDALKAAEYGADLLGFIFVSGTPRAIEKEQAKEIIASLSREVGKVALFKDEDLEKVADIVSFCGMDYVQLHGNENPGYCKELKSLLEKKYGVTVKIIKTFKVAEKVIPHGDYGPADYEEADYLLFDTFHPELAGGTGAGFDKDILTKEKIDKPFFIAGGLTPENVSGAIEKVSPYGVDTSSGVEKEPGKKDENLLKEFIQNAKKK